jgi:DNA-directed RNA polymerase subunit M/transcription elongation factor TFIIS
MENIKCPNCGHEIPIEDALLHKSEEKIRLEYEKKFSEQAAFVNVQKMELEKQSRALEEKAKEQERNLKRLIESGVREQ